MKTQDICPFGPKLQRYWDLRYQYFSRFDDGIQISAEGLHSVMPEYAALMQSELLPTSSVVMDGFCGMGGISIANAKTGHKVIAVDNNQTHIDMAKNNAKIYKVDDKIKFICGDFFLLAKKVNADTVILDPPWGWPGLFRQKEFKLIQMEPDGERILKFALQHFKTIILRVPINFDFSELDKFDIGYKAFYDMLGKSRISISILIDAN